MMDAALPTEPNEIFLSILAAGAHGADLVPLYHQLREAAPQFQADLPRLSNPRPSLRLRSRASFCRKLRPPETGASRFTVAQHYRRPAPRSRTPLLSPWPWM